MHLTLVHNAGAGEGDTSREQLLRALHAAGHRVRYVPHEAARSGRWLDDAGDAVIVAGGDGTVADVALQVAGRDLTLAILPTGTANNIARSFGIPLDVPALLDALGAGAARSAHRVSWSVGEVRAPWGTERFVEAAGVGVFARLLREVKRIPEHEAHMDPSRAWSRHDEIRRARRRLLHVVERAPVRRLSLEADDAALGGDYLMVEALNIRFAGPAIELAPGAGREDGRLVLSVLRADERDAFAAFVAGAIEGRAPPCPLATRRVRRLRLDWPLDDGRLDDRPWPDESRPSGDTVQVEIAAAVARVALLLPRAHEDPGVARASLPPGSHAATDRPPAPA